MTPGANDLCVFAVKRGDIERKRADVLGTYSSIVYDSAYLFPSQKLGHIVSTYSGGTPSKKDNEASSYWGGAIPWVSPKDFRSFYLYDSEDHITEKAIKDSATQKVAPDSVLVVVRSGILKHTLPVAINKVEVTINQDIKVLVPSDSVLPDYLGFYLKVFEKKILGLCVKQSTTVQSVNTREFLSIDIPVPPISTQKQLVERLKVKLQERNQKLEEANRLLENMDCFIHSTLAIKDISFNSSILCAVRVSDLYENGTFSAEYYHSERMAAINAIKASGLVKKLSEIVTFYREIVDSSKSSDAYLGLAGVESQTGELSGVVEDSAGQAFAYDKDDVLYGRLRPYLNKVLFAEQSGICSTEFHVMRVKNENEVLPEYIAAILRSNLILSQTKHMMTGNTHPRISNDDVKNLFIPVPDITVQKEIVEELHGRRQKARRLRIEAEQAWQAAKLQFEKELLGD